jgi:hypothetical protein
VSVETVIRTLILDSLFLISGCMVYARLFCKECEERWRNRENLSYRMVNGILFLGMPYGKPVDIQIDMPWSKFLEFIERRYLKSCERTHVEDVLSAHLMKSQTHPRFLVFVGELTPFLEGKGNIREEIDSRILAYLIDNEGPVSMSQAAKDLRLKADEVKESL